LLHHEKNAFLKFFITYFLSVALLILASGFFYFNQMRGQLLKAEHFSLIEYARHIKMSSSVDGYGDDYHYEFVGATDKHIDIRNFTISKDEFSKFVPIEHDEEYLRVFKSKKVFSKNLFNLKIKTISLQVILLLVFALISYYLAKNAIKPLKESIDTLDKFAKDLIHDLNTPVTAMKLNIKLLEKNPHAKDTKPLLRLKKSVDTISELRENLTVLLEKKTFQVTSINLCDVVRDVMQLHQPNYPELEFSIECNSLFVEANTNALKQILHNLISNGCRYNSKNGYVKIYTKAKTLYIQDSGVGIKEADKILDREYSGQNSSGLGLDIVKRLCDAMGIKVEVVSSNEDGSCFSLEFKNSIKD
jgi:two-component system OmpR family sensor kinase